MMRAILGGGGFLALTALFFAVAMRTQGSYDTYRDLWYAASIAEQLAFPLEGPGIYRTFHLGPLWFYVLAAASLVARLPESAVLLIAALSAAKFPLAYAVGTLAIDRRTGLIAMLVLALPGWWLMELAVLTHTSATSSAVLLVLLFSIRAARNRHLREYIVLGAAIALALHAHPTTAAISGPALLYAVSKARGHRWATIAATTVPSLLLLAPYAAGGGLAADIVSIAAYARDVTQARPAVGNLVLLPIASVVGGGLFASYVWIGLSATWSLLFVLLPLAVVALGTVSAARGSLPHRNSQASAAFAGLFIGQCLFLAIVRPVAPPWMVFSLAPLFSLAVACLVSAGPIARRAWYLAALAALGCGTSLWALKAMASQTGDAMWWPQYASGSPGPMSVTSVPTGRTRVHPVVAPLGEIRSLLRVDCAPQGLHGSLAIVADRTLGYPWLAACGTTEHVRIGGVEASHAPRFSVWDAQVSAFCREDAAAAKGKAWRFRAHAPVDGIRLGDPARYPPRQLDWEVADRQFAVESGGFDLLYVGNLVPGYFPLTIHGVHANGREASLVVRTDAYSVFHCADCARAASRWNVDFTGAEQGLDVVEFSCR